MKRNDQRVPGFDEIIFENRNKNYGAYDLRKRYKSAAGISLFGGIALFSIPVILISLFAPEPVDASTDKNIYVVLKTENLNQPEKIVDPEPQKPASSAPEYKYIEPKVVDDSLGMTDIMTNDLAVITVINEEVTLTKDSVGYAPPVTDLTEDTEPLVFVEEPPQFPGGDKALLKYLAENTTYPAEALENNVEGKVIVKFAVSATGSVTRTQVLRGVNPLLDAEAIRVVSSLPAFRAGRQNGKPVPVWYSVPVTFHLVINN